MALAQKAPPTTTPKRGIWKKPRSRSNWIWLAASILLYAGISVWNYLALKMHPDAGPAIDPFRIFGIIAYAMVLVVTAYTLRRRFIRTLPGRVESWLWLHTWLGTVTILVALQHETYLDLPNKLYLSSTTFIDSDFGVSALYGLIAIVLSGIIGRFLDMWQSHVISSEANKNGVGIIGAVEKKIHEQDLLIERLYAGKSVAFKEFFNWIVNSKKGPKPASHTPIAPDEMEILQKLQPVVASRMQLRRSLLRQKQANSIIRGWRYVHITIACLGLAFISLHSLLELTAMLLHR